MHNCNTLRFHWINYSLLLCALNLLLYIELQHRSLMPRCCVPFLGNSSLNSGPPALAGGPLLIGILSYSAAIDLLPRFCSKSPVAFLETVFRKKPKLRFNFKKLRFGSNDFSSIYNFLLISICKA